MAYSAEALFLELVEDLSPYLLRDFSLETRPFIGRVSQLPSDATPTTVAATALFESFYKKLADDADPDCDSRALQTYLEDNTRCAGWVPPTFGTEYEAELWGTFKAEVFRFFNSGDYQSTFLAQPRESEGLLVGPGSNTGCRGYDYYTKVYDSPLSCTSPGLYRRYVEYRSCVYGPDDPAEQTRHGRYGETFEPVEKLSFVPKNRTTSRTIGIQPTVNMVFQKKAGGSIEAQLERVFGLAIADQPEYNRALAKLGSMGLGYDTTDLKSASNGISVDFLRHILAPDTYGELAMSRTPSVLLPNGEVVKLHIFSAMGNGFTFPLQTALFTCMAAAAYRLRGLRFDFRPRYSTDARKTRVNVDAPTIAVFGDDIITRCEATKDVHTLLRMSGFIVNADKTFVEGPFRESCGYDYYNGRNVRGVYVKTLRSQQSRAVAHNRLLLWSVKQGIRLDRTLGYLYGWLDVVKGKAPLVPLWEADDAGVKVSKRLLPSITYNEYGGICYRAWQNQTKKLQVLEDEIVTPSSVARKREYNPYGAMDAFLSGTIRAGKIVLSNPSGEASYRLTRRSTPNWDTPEKVDYLDGYVEGKLSKLLDRRVLLVEFPVHVGFEFVEAWREVRTQPWDITPAEVQRLTAFAPGS